MTYHLAATDAHRTPRHTVEPHTWIRRRRGHKRVEC